MRWKWVSGLAGLQIFVLIGVLYVIATSYNFNKLKPGIFQTVREATARELTLGGFQGPLRTISFRLGGGGDFPKRINRCINRSLPLSENL